MYYGPTANLVSGQLVACYEDSCEIYNGGEWHHLINTRSWRYCHSTAVKEDRILLIGGSYSISTEWISVDGSSSQPGPFDVRHGYHHCIIQLSADIIVVTGGYETEEYVTNYKLSDGSETPLTPMVKGKFVHACGVYQDAGGQQVRRVCSGLELGTVMEIMHGISLPCQDLNVLRMQ